MTGKKKLWAALGTLALVLVVAGASVGITWAALNGTVTSNFNVVYTANNVNATLSAQYCTNGTAESVGTMTEMKSSSASEIEFGVSEATGATKAFDAITGAKFVNPTDYVYIAFHFTNNAEKSLVVTPSFAKSTTTNVVMHYQWVDGEDNTFPESEFSKTFTDGTFGNDSSENSITNGETKTLWIQVNVGSDITDATFAGNFSFKLENAAA